MSEGTGKMNDELLTPSPLEGGSAAAAGKSREAHMVERFLSWKLPADFSPDAGISFNPIYNTGTPYEAKHEPTGTNLFSYAQALAMVRHMIDGLPSPDDYTRGQRDALNAVMSLNPEAAAEVAKWAEKEPDPQGRMPFDVALWVSRVATQLGFETLEGDGPDRFKPGARSAGEAPISAEAVNTSTTIPIVERLKTAAKNNRVFAKRGTDANHEALSTTGIVKCEAVAEIHEAAASVIKTLAGALKEAEQFIANGIELGYIHVPKNDPAESTLPKIRSALSSLREGG